MEMVELSVPMRSPSISNEVDWIVTVPATTVIVPLMVNGKLIIVVFTVTDVIATQTPFSQTKLEWIGWMVPCWQTSRLGVALDVVDDDDDDDDNDDDDDDG